MGRSQDVLSEAALGIVAELHRRFDWRRRALLEARAERQRAFDSGALPDFLPETASIRAGNWRVGDIPADLFDRRVEITGPTDRKMVINALNSGAKVFMAAFEDATAPSRANIVQGPANLFDYLRGRLSSAAPGDGTTKTAG